MNQQLAVIRAHQADLQKARSEWIEIAAREQVSGRRHAGSGQAGRGDPRSPRRREGAGDGGQGKPPRPRSKSSSRSMPSSTEQLDKLRGDFKATVDANRKLVARLKAKKPS